MSPQRIQRRRTRGWRAPDGAVYVGRGTRWGNPFTLDMAYELGYAPSGDTAAARRACAGAFADWLAGNRLMWMSEEGDTARQRIRDGLAELAGRDLMCWCPLPAPGEPDHCHAAVLLRLANGPEATR